MSEQVSTSTPREELAQIKEQQYKDPRPAEYFDRYYDWALTHKPGWVYDAARVVMCIYVWTLFRARARRAGLIPTSGPVIFAPNHFSNIDHFFVGAFTRRKIQFMAKSQLYKGPMQYIYRVGGVFPVRRGHRDERSLEVAHSILDRDGTICMYCEGGRSRSGRISEKARPGIGRMALESGAMIQPAAIHGSEKVRNWKRLQLPSVRVLYGEPFRFEQVENPTREQQQAAADEIFAEIRRLYAELDEELSPSSSS